MRFSPSNHHDRECLLAVTGRVPLELVHDATVLQDHEQMACATGGGPTVPTRINRRRPRPLPFRRAIALSWQTWNLPWWRRLALAWQSWRASFRIR